jgi:hypothetical protein
LLLQRVSKLYIKLREVSGGRSREPNRLNAHVCIRDSTTYGGVTDLHQNKCFSPRKRLEGLFLERDGLSGCG